MPTLPIHKPASQPAAPFCPPAQKPPVQSLAVPNAAALVGTLSARQAYCFVGQLLEPSGWWVRGCDAAVMLRGDRRGLSV